MRDPGRIPAVLLALESAWRSNPDLRLGQLINVAASFVSETSTFYVEDDHMLKALISLTERQANPQPAEVPSEPR